jgi:hypothetical protein
MNFLTPDTFTDSLARLTGDEQKAGKRSTNPVLKVRPRSLTLGTGGVEWQGTESDGVWRRWCDSGRRAASHVVSLPGDMA